jgi:hypothetical protein
MALAIAYLNAVQVPPKTHVSMPPYPGAVVIQTTPAQTGEANGEAFEMLPVIVLVATDDVETVAAFYRERLAAWNTMSQFGQHYFWEGDVEFNPFDMVGTAKIPAVTVMEDMDRDKLVKGAAAEIQVRYREPDK